MQKSEKAPQHRDTTLSTALTYDTYLAQRTGMSKNHTLLLDILNSIPFESPIRMDENRANEGLELRDRYFDGWTPQEYSKKPCTFLEFLVSFAETVNEQTSYISTEEHWFQMFMQNIWNLDRFDDASVQHIPGSRRRIESSCRRCLSRDYENGSKGGNGCLFRYKKTPAMDLRRMEYWKQLQYWVLEIPISDE